MCVLRRSLGESQPGRWERTDEHCAGVAIGDQATAFGVTYCLPTLQELPDDVPEAEVWPKLAAYLGADCVVGQRERRWLEVAVTHRSGLYESRALSVVVSPECLSLLEGVGNAVLDLELRVAVGDRHPEWETAERDQRKAQLIGNLRRAVVAELEIAENALLGIGERLQAASGKATRSAETVMMQVLGWWSLILEGDGIRDLVRQVLADLPDDPAAGLESMNLFHRNFDRFVPQFTYTRQGPDHAALFETTVTTRDGRSSKAVATRKKDATRLACHAYLTAYAPHLLRRTGSSPPPFDLPFHLEHQRLARTFGASDALPFSQAVTHYSWVHENTRHRDRRVSNEVLANLGSGVLEVLMTRIRAAYLLNSSTRPDPSLSSNLTVPDEELVSLSLELELPAMSRLGAGQRQHGPTREMQANLVQAVLAAGYLQAGDIVAFEARLPAAVIDFLVAHSGRSTRDAMTRLQELAMELDLKWIWTDQRTGPDHASTYHSTIEITDGSATVMVQGAAAGRTAAKKAAAAKAMEAAGLRSEGVTEVKRPDMARFFLARQLEVLGAKPARWPRWQQQNVLGATWVAERDWGAFTQWAVSAEHIGLLEIEASAPAHVSLADYYRRAARSSGARPLFAGTLARVLRWVGHAMEDDRVILDDTPWDELIGLTVAQGIWLAADTIADLAEVLKKATIPERRRRPVRVDVRDSARTTAQAGAAVQRILQQLRPAVGSTESALHATLIPGQARHEIRLGPASGWAGGSERVVTLACEAAGIVDVERGDEEIVLRVGGAANVGSGWLWDVAFRTGVSDDNDAELARLLHDLKNEVTGARVALGYPTTTRTERREADLAASRHIDSAAAIAARLVDAALLYDTAQAGECDLVSFLRGYSSDLINRLPRGIRLVPPSTSAARVAVSAEVLRNALDNLVKNAVEAMGSTGQIELEYTSVEDDGVVLLEVRDTGPGLPDDLITSIRDNSPAQSTKLHGSGLGLPGAMRMMRRAGGDLYPLHSVTGAVWQMTLPLVEQSGVVDD